MSNAIRLKLNEHVWFLLFSLIFSQTVAAQTSLETLPSIEPSILAVGSPKSRVVVTIPNIPDNEKSYAIFLKQFGDQAVMHEHPIVLNSVTRKPEPIEIEVSTEKPSVYEVFIREAESSKSIPLPLILRIVEVVSCEEAVVRLANSFRDSNEELVMTYTSEYNTTASEHLKSSFLGKLRPRFAAALLSPLDISVSSGACVVKLELVRSDSSTAQLSISLGRSLDGQWKVLSW